MSRRVYKFKDGKFVEVYNSDLRSTYKGIRIGQNPMDAALANGSMIDLKNPPKPEPEKDSYGDIEAEMTKAYYDLRDGAADLSEYERHICKEENERLRRR